MGVFFVGSVTYASVLIKAIQLSIKSDVIDLLIMRPIKVPKLKVKNENIPLFEALDCCGATLYPNYYGVRGDILHSQPVHLKPKKTTQTEIHFHWREP